ncbi:MAG: adenosylmethionine--8-amino-7-oxononanoate transaminase [Planctomycetota bacterium]|jgi:adenosylmethionine-8-amino-7-oxononanoate aminotransferase
MRESEISRLRGLDLAHVWHPFTQMKVYPGEEPLIIDRGEGNFLVDVEGVRYFDGVSSLWSNLHGHARAEINDAVSAQLARIGHSTLLGHANVPSIELAARLAEVAPEGLTKVFYSDSGSEAMEIAAKIAFAYWRHRGEPERAKFVGTGEAYHGDTVGAVSMGGIDTFHALFRPLLFETYRIPAPYCYRCPMEKESDSCKLACLREAERAIEAHADELAAVVVESTFMAAAGMIMQPEGWLRGIADAAKRAGTLLIVDEVAVGFGRTGAMFGVDREGVRPDLMACAKGLSGGYLPLAATLATPEVHDAFLGDYAEKKVFYHGHTYTGNQLGCAAALASLDIIQRENVVARVRENGDAFVARMNELCAELPHVGEIRMKGLFGGIELVRDRATRARYPFESRTGHRVCMAARKRGMFLRPLGDVIVLVPPLSSTPIELATLAAAAAESISEVTAPA